MYKHKNSIACLFLLVLLGTTYGYKPVIYFPGLFAKVHEISNNLAKFIEEEHPGTKVVELNAFDGIFSLVPLEVQLKRYLSMVKPLMQHWKDGVHFVCYSQGGLICRGILEHMSNHNVNTLITLSSPLMGQFGMPDEWKKFLPHLNRTRDEISKLLYTFLAQDSVSIANYWKDPRDKFYGMYLSYCKFLTSLDNNPKAPGYNESIADAIKRKKNFLKIKHLVALGGRDDGVINPWESALYGYYDANLNVVPMEKQEIYYRVSPTNAQERFPPQKQAFIEDWFGLRTLYKRNAVTTYSIPGVGHHAWHTNKTVFDLYIEKWLT